MKALSSTMVASILLCSGLLAEQGAPRSSETVLRNPAQIIPLSESVTLETAGKQSLALMPGLRAVRLGEGYSISTFDGSALALETSTGRSLFPSPALAIPTENGWTISGFKFAKDSLLTANRKTQDDTDSNLKSMQENAKKLKAKNPPTNNPNQPNQPNNGNNQGNPATHWRLLFSENPMPTAELFNAAAIQQLSHVSPIGF